VLELDDGDRFIKVINIALPNFSAALDDQAQAEIIENIIG